MQCLHFRIYHAEWNSHLGEQEISMHLEHARGQHLSPSLLPSFNQPKLLQPEYHMSEDTEKKRTNPNPTNQLFRAVMPPTSTDGVTHRATHFFSPNTFYCKKATESSVPLPESLTIDCFSLAFLWYHILSVFTLQCFKIKQKGWSCLHSVSAMCCLCYSHAVRRNQNPLRLKNTPNWIQQVLLEQKETIISTSFPPIFSHFILRKTFSCCMHAAHLHYSTITLDTWLHRYQSIQLGYSQPGSTLHL